MDKIDLRSDTVSWPTPEMREAMANAPVGDDVFGEDPTVNRLQAEAAEMFGKEAGLLVSSGTQGNLVSVLTHCERGTEAILGEKNHIFKYEAGGISALGGIMPHTIPVQDDGTMLLDDIRHAIRADNIHFPPTRLICMENTHGTVYGIPVTAEYTNQVAEIAKENNLKLHVDGARIFNAAAALNVDPKALVENADSMTFCLSKGLCAPVGSIIVGSQEFIDKARRVRKILGGGMRQAGTIAAAGLIALNDMSKRIGEDHETAKMLADGLADIPGITMKTNYTNFVFFDLEPDAKLSPAEFMQKLDQDYNILMIPYPGYINTFRCVTHYWITKEKVQTVIEATKTILS